jgi:HlyD family secretion protein
MKRTLWLTLIVVSIIIGAIFWPKTKTVEAVLVTQGALAQRIIATGRIAPAARIDVASLISANVNTVHVKEGDTVKAGDTLITLTDAALIANLQQAKSSLKEAQQRLQEAETLTLPLSEHNLNQATSTLSFAKADYQRQLSLSQKNMISPSALEQAKRNLDVANAALDSAKLQKEANATNGSSRRLLQSRLTQAEASLALAQAKIDQLTLLAPVPGTVIARNAETGTSVQPGKALITIAAMGETRVEVPIDEKSLHLIQEEQTATIIADAYPKHPFGARLTLIYPSIDAARAIVNARLIVDQPPPFLRHDMTVSVDMLIGEAKDALIVPTDAIHAIDGNTPWVLTIVDGVATETPVTLGIQGIGHSQIMSGLKRDDWVITQQNTVAGDRVKPKARIAQKARGFDVPAGIK